MCVCLIELFFSFFDVVCFLLFREKKTCLNLQKCFVFFRREFRKEENKHKIANLFFVVRMYLYVCVCVVWVSFGAHTSTKKKCHFLLYKFCYLQTVSPFSITTFFLTKWSKSLSLPNFCVFFFLSAAFKLENKTNKKVRIIFLTTKLIKRKKIQQ